MANTSNTYKTSALPVVNSIGANDRLVVLHSPESAPNTVTISQSKFVTSVVNSLPVANTTSVGVVKVGNNLTINATSHLNMVDPNFDYILESNTTFYVRTDGNDNNNGLTNDSTGAFATLQKACDTMARVNAKGHGVTIQVANGTYEVVCGPTRYAHTGIAYTPFSASYFKILGNTTNPENVVLYNNNSAPDSEGYCILYLGNAPDGTFSTKTNISIDRFEGFTAKFAKDYYCEFAETYKTYVIFHNIRMTNDTPWSTLFISGTDSTIFAGYNSSELGLYIDCQFGTLALAINGGIFNTFKITYGPSAQVLGTFIWSRYYSYCVYEHGAPYIAGTCAAGPSSRKYRLDNFGMLVSYGTSASIPGTQAGIVATLGILDN